MDRAAALADQLAQLIETDVGAVRVFQRAASLVAAGRNREEQGFEAIQALLSFKF